MAERIEQALVILVLGGFVIGMLFVSVFVSRGQPVFERQPEPAGGTR